MVMEAALTEPNEPMHAVMKTIAIDAIKRACCCSIGMIWGSAQKGSAEAIEM